MTSTGVLIIQENACDMIKFLESSYLNITGTTGGRRVDVWGQSWVVSPYVKAGVSAPGVLWAGLQQQEGEEEWGSEEELNFPQLSSAWITAFY